MRKWLSLVLVASFWIASPGFAEHYRFSIAPASGPTSGGTRVTITQLGGTFGPADFVRFAGVDAVTTRTSSTTLVAVTPENVPGDAVVELVSGDTTLQLGHDFTYEGPAPAKYTRILLPLYIPPVSGAHGSEFHTDLTLRARNDLVVHGIDTNCYPVPQCLKSDRRVEIQPNVILRPETFDYELHAGTPGRFVYIEKAHLPSLTASLRVHDVTRSELNYGTEIPVVPEDAFIPVDGEIVLLNVPTSEQFRSMLRIYSSVAQTILVNIAGVERAVHLTKSPSVNHPAFAAVSDFPTGLGPIDVLVSLPPGAAENAPFWAFISVTNNETQLITTITPQL